MDDLEKRAEEFATWAHDGQSRKYTGEPYVTHCGEVASMVKAVGGTPEMVAAAWLHDTVEDCSRLGDLREERIATITAKFGGYVALLVAYLSDVSKPSDGNRAARKAIDREHIASAPVEAKTIKLADMISNTSSIGQHDPNFAKVYLREKLALLEVLEDGNRTLLVAARALVWKYFEDRLTSEAA